MGTSRKEVQSKGVLPDPDYYDEIPLWSASFGLSLLKNVKYKQNMQILDIGCGTGFPLIELASAAGSKSKVFGIDPWEEALDRAKRKASLRGLNNVRVLDCCAEELPFQNNSFDLVVSNNGLNNVTDIYKVLAEANRVSKKNAQLVFTANLPGTFSLFYNELKVQLRKMNRDDVATKINRHIQQKRFTVKKWENLMLQNGFSINKVELLNFEWRFANTNAFLNHPFIADNFKPSWEGVIPNKIKSSLMKNVVEGLDSTRDNLILKIPYVCMDCRKT
ncbi:MAG: class I SAM-dependent methyltransferase [Bacteroidota bacterium]